MFRSFFNIYLYIYIYLYLNIYIEKEQNVLRSFAKERNVLAFFPVLYKRTGWSLRSFPFFAKEQDVLYVLFRSFEKNGKGRSVLLGLIRCQNLKKRTGKNGTFFKRAGKTRTFWTGKNVVPNPAQTVQRKVISVQRQVLTKWRTKTHPAARNNSLAASTEIMVFKRFKKLVWAHSVQIS